MDSAVNLLVPDNGGKDRSKQCYSKNFILLLIVVFCFVSTLFYILFPNPFEFKSNQEDISLKGDSVSMESENEDNSTENVLLNQTQYRLAEEASTINSNASSVERTPVVQYTFEDLNKFLCAQESKPPNNTRVVSRRPCPVKGIVTAIAGGRTGNQMWEYASIWAIGKKLNLEPFVPTCIKWKLEVMFDHLSLPTFRAIAHCPFDFNSSVSSVGKAHKNKSVILPRFQFRISEALPWMKQILKEFHFKQELMDNAQHILHELVAELPAANYTFIGVHVRRADYIKYVETRFHREPVTEHFFERAMAYYREHYSNCLFIYLSDDPQWCFNQFGNLTDVFVASINRNDTAEEDLALMQACNHSIIDYGTFGEWGSILAGGHTVASRTKVIHQITRNWGHWTLIDDVSEENVQKG